MVLLFVALLNGCSILGIDLTDDRTITVIKSPYLISLSGDVEQADEKFVSHTLNFLSTQPFQEYNFTSVQIHVSGSESDYKRSLNNNDITINPQGVQE